EVFLGEVCECPMLFFFVEAVGGTGGWGVEPRAGQQEDVHPAVVVVVKEGATAAGGFQNVVVVGGIAVDHGRGQTGVLGDIGEMGVERAPRKRRFGLRL